jgi:hypothetical protein
VAQRLVVFYSWQSDLKGSATRYLIQEALEGAVEDIGSDPSLDIEPVVDRDTYGMSGSPSIKEAIFTKIDGAAVFVGDVTTIGKLGPKQRSSPNPNVMQEVGYAEKALGWSRVILVLNTAFGTVDEMPFDLRGHRVLTFSSAEDAAERAPERRKLRAGLRDAIAAVLLANEALPGAYPAELSMKYERESGSNGEVHNYQLLVSLKNNGTATITNWHIDVWVPRAVVRPHVGQAHERRSEGTETHALFRFTPEDSPQNKRFHPGSTETRRVLYHMTGPLHWHGNLENEVITAMAYMNDQLVATSTLTFDEWQNF